MLFLKESEYDSMHPGSSKLFFQICKAYRGLTAPLGNNSKIMKILPELLVFGEREDHRNFVSVLVNDILFRGTHGNSSL